MRVSHFENSSFVPGFSGRCNARIPLSLLDAPRRGLYRSALTGAAELSMQDGLYSVHIHMLDGVKGRDSGVLILRSGMLIGGGPYFWSVGSYTAGNGTWKGELSTNQHTPFADPFVRPLFDGHEVTSGFSGTFAGDESATAA
jgi:hypothetical protein